MEYPKEESEVESSKDPTEDSSEYYNIADHDDETDNSADVHDGHYHSFHHATGLEHDDEGEAISFDR